MTATQETIMNLPSVHSSDDFSSIASPPDSASVADALAGWLAALGVANHTDNYAIATENCVSLCSVFASLAPHLLSDTDFFVPSKASSTVATRQRRYNTRRLARSLAEWFGVGSRANSPVSNQTAPSDTNSSSSATSSTSLHDAARVRIKSITDAARAEGDSVDDPALRLALGELVLCAAINSDDKKRFVQAVLSLNSCHQETLAHSIKYFMSESDHSPFNADSSPPTVLGEVRASSENAPPPLQFTSLPNASGSAKKTKPHPVGILAPQSIPLAEFKAIAEERDALRKKLAICEAERNEAVENSENLQHELQLASDKLQEFKSKIADYERIVEEKSSELSDAKAALRAVSQNSEEVERLRSKASTAEQLEISLKRAGKRLEDVADMRNKMKGLESQVGALRSNEDLMSKQIEILQSQLTSANERAQNLVKVSDDLSHELESKTGEVRDIMSKNQELTTKLETANEQLGQLLMAPAPAAQPQVEEKSQGSELDNEAISKRLSEEVGVHMAWTDIVECIRGVVEAMNEMDEMSRRESNNSEASFNSRGSDSHANPDQPSEKSSQDGETGASQPGVQLLPDFSVVDQKYEAQRGDTGDEFDRAVDHPNIQEIPVMNRRPSLSTVPEDREGFEDDQDDDVPEPVSLNPNSVGVSSSTIHDAPVGHGFPIISNHHGEIPPVGGSDNLMVVRQTRSDMPGMQNTLDAVRMEQETNSSLAALLQQLADARDSTDRFKSALAEKERECETLRHDLSSLIKEHDSALTERKESRARDAEVMHEKERMISHLERTLASREEELADLRKQKEEGQRKANEALRQMEMKMARDTHEHTVMVRSQEIEIARLTTKLEAQELLAGKLSVAMDKTDGLTEEIHKARETYLQDMAEAARREKEAAEEARLEAERMAATHQRAVADMRQAQSAAAAARAPSVCCSDSARKHRRSSRITTFWRKIMHLDNSSDARGNITSTVLGTQARMQAPHPAVQAATAGPAMMSVSAAAAPPAVTGGTAGEGSNEWATST